MTNKYVYPILITQEKDSSGFEYLVYIPDFEGYTQASSVAESIEMARDYIGLALLEMEERNEKFPIPSEGSHAAKSNELNTLVDIDFLKFKAANDNKVIKKTLSIPNYLNQMGNEAGINFSALLTEALKQKLGA